ncbi:hypothetical protein A7K99_12450 [Tatumella citrea]|uniref:Uncharacterized protein n=1 Tax=Tatumella citrea TaxID=53336 RepID=A0A1Y0L8Y1_TATCI|nr:hypothetical protein A7K98_12455 [Tatumella citrea]ARU98545.1 hypothetical protein A7K99_12450 [Tatumella citrea]
MRIPCVDNPYAEQLLLCRAGSARQGLNVLMVNRSMWFTRLLADCAGNLMLWLVAKRCLWHRLVSPCERSTGFRQKQGRAMVSPGSESRPGHRSEGKTDGLPGQDCFRKPLSAATASCRYETSVRIFSVDC